MTWQGSVDRRATHPRSISRSKAFGQECSDQGALRLTPGHEVTQGVRAELRFAGDLFEMEDQRNWTDGSFKIYGTPLSLPFPVEIRAGDRVRQRVTMSLEGTAAHASEKPPARRPRSWRGRRRA